MDQTCPVVHKSRRPQARLKDSHTVLHTYALWSQRHAVNIELKTWWMNTPNYDKIIFLHVYGVCELVP
jgi:hypothetical protein